MDSQALVSTKFSFNGYKVLRYFHFLKCLVFLQDNERFRCGGRCCGCIALDWARFVMSPYYSAPTLKYLQLFRRVGLSCQTLRRLWVSHIIWHISLTIQSSHDWIWATFVSASIPSSRIWQVFADLTMTSGFSTIAGSVLAAYIGLGVPATNLVTSSVMSIPASMAISKIRIPETEEPVTRGHVTIDRGLDDAKAPVSYFADFKEYSMTWYIGKCTACFQPRCSLWSCCSRTNSVSSSRLGVTCFANYYPSTNVLTVLSLVAACVACCYFARVWTEFL